MKAWEIVLIVVASFFVLFLCYILFNIDSFFGTTRYDAALISAGNRGMSTRSAAVGGRHSVIFDYGIPQDEANKYGFNQFDKNL